MNKRFPFFVLLSLVFIFGTSGIIRQDVKEKRYTRLAAEKQFDVVGQVFIGTEPGGSAVLINNRFILSAAHVFIESDYRQDTLIVDGKTIISYKPINNMLVSASKVTIRIKDEILKIKKITLHPNYRVSNTDSSCDLAILELESPFKKVKPLPINWDQDEKGAHVTGVGFGASGIADRPETVVLLNKKIAGQNVIDSLGDPAYQGKPTLLIADFDHPTRTDCNKMGSSKPEPLDYLPSGGDSGGGLFRKKNKHWELIGICSRSGIDDIQLFYKTGYYGQTMAWIRTSVFKNRILDNTK